MIPIILIVLVIAGIINAFKSCSIGKREKFNWSNDFDLHDMLPQPKSNVGEIISNSENALCIYIHKYSFKEFKEYRDECQSMGYTIDSEKTEFGYSAYNEEGYKLYLYFDDSENKMTIDLDAPIEMGTLTWPTSTMVNLLPVPQSNIGKIDRESSDYFFVYIGNTSKDDYNTYVNQCIDNGFNIDYNKGDDNFYADHENGCDISVEYLGNQIMSIRINKPSDVTLNDVSEPDPPTDNADIPVEESTSEPTPSPDIVTSNTNSTNLVNGMRLEFKEAMDSYENFIYEYCDFMKKYSESDNVAAMIVDYTKYMAKYAEMTEKFSKLEEDNLNETEQNYYIEVLTRTNQRMLEIAQ